VYVQTGRQLESGCRDGQSEPRLGRDDDERVAEVATASIVHDGIDIVGARPVVVASGQLGNIEKYVGGTWDVVGTGNSDVRISIWTLVLVLQSQGY